MALQPPASTTTIRRAGAPVGNFEKSLRIDLAQDNASIARWDKRGNSIGSGWAAARRVVAGQDRPTGRNESPRPLARSALGRANRLRATAFVGAATPRAPTITDRPYVANAVVTSAMTQSRKQLSETCRLGAERGMILATLRTRRRRRPRSNPGVAVAPKRDLPSVAVERDRRLLHSALIGGFAPRTASTLAVDSATTHVTPAADRSAAVSQFLLRRG